jgi:hypothetical protein
MSSGVDFLDHHRKRLSTVGSERFVVTHESFVHELAARQDDPTDGLDAAVRACFGAFFSERQRQYLAIKEREAHEEMMAVANGATVPVVENISEGFGRAAYQRVGDLEELVDFHTCHNVVMVGCGAFPATLFWLHDHFPGARYKGLDIDVQCVEMASKLTTAMSINNICFEVVDGRHYDFDSVDFVYVANHVVPKRAVLAQIGRSESVRQVVVREPTRRGELLAESVQSDLPAVFAVDAAGGENRSFLSYDLALRRADIAE